RLYCHLIGHSSYLQEGSGVRGWGLEIMATRRASDSSSSFLIPCYGLDNDHTDIILAAGAVGGSDERLAGALQIRCVQHDPLHLGVRHHLPQTVGAEEQSVEWPQAA